MVEPGYAPYEKTIKDFQDMKEVVGGIITTIYPYEELVAIICNDEALLMNMPFNRSVEGGYGGVFGTFIVCGLSDDNYCSLTPEQTERFKRKFYQAEILLGAKGNKAITLKVPPKLKEKSNHKSEKDFKERE